jgi:protein-L-isoaspartate O-methyltransferase
MTHEINLYDGYYGHLAADPQVEVRRETYGEDLGQASWITASEARRWFDLLHLSRGQTALEVACGSGGVTCAMANHAGATCVGGRHQCAWHRSGQEPCRTRRHLVTRRFLDAVYILASERRLSRYMYLAEKSRL